MRQILRRYFANDDKGVVALVLLLGLAYLSIFIAPAQAYTTAEVIALLALGLFYLIFNLEGFVYCLNHRRVEWIAAFFIIDLTVCVTIEWVCHISGAFWLLFLPLVNFAVVLLPVGWILGTCAAVLVAFALPLFIQSVDLARTWQSIVSYAAAVVFVVIFSQISLNEKNARLALAEANHKLREYAAQAEELAITKERNRVAREIHDSLGHFLTVINIQIGAAQAIIETDQPRAVAALQKAQALTREGLAEVRQSVGALRASPLDNRALLQAVTALVVESRTAGIITELTVNGTPRVLTPLAELTLYRAIQEGLTNVRKHACASRVDLSLDYYPAQVRLKVADNGIGNQSETSQGFGLLGLKERVQLLSGAVRVQTGPGQGFALEVELPV